MIVEALENSHLIENTHPLFAKAFKWLRENASPNMPDGRIEVDSDRIVAIPQHPVSHILKDDLYEAHRKYIDIQYIISGEETIFLGDAAAMTPVNPFDADKDIVFMRTGGRTFKVPVKPGSFMVIWPHEAHQPCVNDSAPGSVVHKIIIKVKAAV